MNAQQAKDDLVYLDSKNRPCSLKATPFASVSISYREGTDGRESIRTIQLDDVIGVELCLQESSTRGKVFVVKFHVFRNNTPYRNNSAGKKPSFEHVVKTFSAQLRGDENVYELVGQLKRPVLRSMSQRFSRPLLIMINSFGGAGKAVRLFDAVVKPILTLASVPYEVEVTKSSTHAIDWAREADLSRYMGIAIMSGDGLINQVVNGLMTRPDWVSAVRTPLALFPCGTHNALAGHVLYESGVMYSTNVVRAATYVCLGHHTSDLDVMLVETAHERAYAVLMVAWGFVADMNNDAAKYRWMGTFRVVLTALTRMATLPAYGGRVDYLPFDDAPSLESDVVPTTDGEPRRRYLPPITQPVPDNWTTIRGNFSCVMPFKGPAFSDHVCALPEARLGDGAIYLMVYKAGLTGLQFMQMANKLERRLPNYRMQDEPFLEIHKVVAFRVTPDNDSGGLCVDGEVIKTEPFQGEVMKGVGQVMLRK